MGVRLPQSNCTITRVERRGRTDTWSDDEETTATELWAGSARAYLRIKRRRDVQGGVESLLVERTLIVGEGVPPVAWESELTVEFAVTGEAAQEGVVRHVERARLPGHPLQTTRLILEAT